MLDLMKKNLTSLSLSISSLLLTAPTVLAQGAPPAAGGARIDPCLASDQQFAALCKLNADRFGELLGTGFTMLFILAALVALFYLLWGGFKWITSGGDSKSVDAARSHIIAAIIGLVIIFLSYFIINVVLYFFTGKTLQNITLPRLPA